MDLSTPIIQPSHVLSLFSGIGGLDLALKLAVPTSRTVCYVERDIYALAVLVSRIEDKALDSAPIWSDVSTFDGRPWRGIVDTIIGGYPCQDISQAGKGAGIYEGKRSGLWTEYTRIIREIRPALVFVENVSALLSRGIERVLGDLAALGYDAEWTMLSAKDCGAPHLRERVFLLAYSCESGRSEESRGASSLRDAPEWRNQDNLAKRNCEDVAYTHGQRQQQPTGDYIQGRERPCDNSETEEVGVAHLTGLEGRIRPIAQRADRFPTWPPGPEASNEWQIIREQWPWFEPAVCRMVDGTSDRLDRLRVLGNGVVPVVGATAWRVLFDRIRSVR